MRGSTKEACILGNPRDPEMSTNSKTEDMIATCTSVPQDCAAAKIDLRRYPSTV